MHCTLRRPSTTSPDEADKESSFQLRKFLEKDNLNSSTKDSSETTSAGWRDLDCRYAVYLWTPEPDGQWKLVALPLGHVHHVNQMGSTTPAISVSSPQSRNRGTGNTFLISKEETSKKRRSRKKKKKKGKHKKKLSKQISKTGSESVPECGASQNGDNNDIHNGVVPLASTTKLADSSPENSGNENCSERTSTSDYPCTSCLEEAGVSESLTPSICPNSSSDHHISEFGDGHQTAGVQDIKCGVISYPNACSQNPMLDSPSLGYDCAKFNSDYGFTLSNEEKNGTALLNPPDFVAREGCPGNTFYDIVTSDIHSQKTNCSRQLCHLDMLEKRVKKIKRGPQNLSVGNVSSVGNLYGPSRKETNHSTGRKVQNSEARGHNHDLKNVNTVCSQFDNELKKASTHEKHTNTVCAGVKSDSAIKRQTNTKVSAKMNLKNNLGSKQEFSYYNRNGSQAFRDSSDSCTSFNMQHNELRDIPKHMNGEIGPGIELRSQPKSKFATSGFRTGRVESIRFGQLESSQASLSEVEPLQSYASTSFMNNQNVESRTYYSLTSGSSLSPPELLEKLSAIELHTLSDHEEAKVGKKDSLAPSDHKKDSSSGAVWQKRVPIKDSSLAVAKIDEPAGESRAQKNIVEEDLVSDSHSSVRAASSGSICNRGSLNDVNSSPSNNVVQVKNFGNQTVSILKEYSNTTKCFAPEYSNQHLLTPDNNSSKLLSAVIDSQRAQVASEAIQVATGCPIAEFEKLLHSVSPVICTSPTTESCQICSHNSLCAIMCQHEVPNISLGELWKWYERHGSYGLEVKVDYENSCRLGIDSVTFRAYFVPYLSAVQLFTKSKVLHYGNGFSAACAMEKGSITENIPVSPADCGGSDKLEILFEYFESEQPQRRRPLYEMINKLVRGEVSSRCRVHGDATILNSSSMRDLHPKSWYSVAWYPIYRIPDGNLRAAFLTYHSLGHLVQRQPPSYSACMDLSVVSPAVGLQTYNAQGECWFQPRHSADVLNFEPARTLKERLRTLEQTASLMARAVVTKGNETTVNRQPDYEFFLSRQGC